MTPVLRIRAQNHTHCHYNLGARWISKPQIRVSVTSATCAGLISRIAQFLVRWCRVRYSRIRVIFSPIKCSYQTDKRCEGGYQGFKVAWLSLW